MSDADVVKKLPVLFRTIRAKQVSGDLRDTIGLDRLPDKMVFFLIYNDAIKI